jgi:hypothetical protein
MMAGHDNTGIHAPFIWVFLAYLFLATEAGKDEQD